MRKGETMIRRALLALVFVASAGTSAHAATSDDIELFVDVDLTAYLVNKTGADISFDGYQIASEINGLDVAGWDSISDRISDRQEELMQQLGAGALGFGEMAPTSAQVAEANFSGVGVLKANARFSLGKPFGDAASVVEVMNQNDFFFKIGGIPEQFTQVYITPEPSTWLLASLAGLGLVAMRIRSKRSTS